MPHSVSNASTGLQALILCGPGSSFPTFTSNPDENPKALLPIANRPMVWYPIDLCYRTGVSKITLVCPPSAAKAMKAAMGTNPHLTGLPMPRPEIVCPADLTQTTGTAEILRLPEIYNHITGDFIVLPCDLVCEFGAEQLLQAWMVKAASATDLLGAKDFSNGSHSRPSGGIGVWYETKNNVTVKGEETDFVATTALPQSATMPPKGSILANVSRVVCTMPTDALKDRMEERKGLDLRYGLLRANPRTRMLTTHRDAHIYIFPRWILDFIQANDRFESIGEDVVGWWAKASWQEGLAEKLKIMGSCKGDAAEHAEFNPDSDAGASDQNSSTAGDESSRATRNSSEPMPPMIAYLHSNKTQEAGSIIRRVDTAQLLLAISLQLAKLPSLEEADPDAASPFAHPRKVAYPEGVKPRTTITKADSLIAENVTVEEKTSMKECVIGAGCQIQEGAKLSQCLLMDGVVVGKGCKLTKCILGKRSVIGDGCILTDCEVQENLLVEPRTEDKDNRLMSSEGLEATEAEMQEVLGHADDDMDTI
ncbi:Bacterial transferase hexapeptide repeat protein [Cordyceps fumosorosea ARSEF 2679]|uniref:Mannose-1-phosphate guanyltransferase n=1 Tax=Cordyceps fumosorosea (strain ARSEF 2679) TaxID=1081104 RepID=A0A167LAP5_CORFA|nr:Bacterial transferase hexapeptide repeat protein [Cordyceps fumosorosea ARSEF 2679]OAA52853.1 Bacterial transferase hexapeptide repeat protein [Cordyceps fumosorosea ARSEF 2679]